MPALVLMVHGEVATLERALSALRGAGYEAAGFGDPMLALGAIEAAPRVRVLVTPAHFGPSKINGLALARTCRLRCPGLMVVFLAGLWFRHYVEAGILLPPRPTAEALVLEVRRILETPGSLHLQA